MALISAVIPKGTIEKRRIAWVESAATRKIVLFQ